VATTKKGAQTQPSFTEAASPTSGTLTVTDDTASIQPLDQ